MKKFLLLLLLASGTAVFAKTYYVAPTGGSDSYAGTNIAQPWATWQKAFNTAQPGDTVYFRGGAWKGATTAPILDPTISHGHNGTHAHPICFFNYPGEKPVLDCSSYTATNDKIALGIQNVTYIKFRGLTVANCQQKVSGQWISGISVLTCGNLYFDQVSVTNTGGYGFWTSGYDTLYLVNCDSYNNVDYLASDPGNRSDGFQIASGSEVGDYTLITGCRSWQNSDDGFEINTEREVHFFNNWSFGNGRLVYGNGIGVKIGPSYLSDISKREFHNNVVADNKGFGISHNFLDEGPPVASFYNNSIYKCSMGFNDDPGDWLCSSRGGHTVHRNNIVYNVTDYQCYLEACVYQPEVGPVYNTADHNTWTKLMVSPFCQVNPAYNVTAADFVSLDTTGMSGPRASDGSLPATNFMKLVSGSDLIDTGVDVGLPFNGSAPDLGAFEYGGVTNQKPVTSITVTGAGGSTTITTNLGTLQLSASVLPADASNKTVTWSIANNTGKASINSSGLVTAIANGTVTARATAKDGSGVYGTLTITITNQLILVSGITVTGAGGATAISTSGGTLQLSAVVLPTNASNMTVTWTVTNGTGQATISTGGLVNAVTNGTVTARATANDASGVYGTLSITISNQVILVNGITLTGAGGATTITSDNGTLQLSAGVMPVNATNKTVTWSISSGTDKASISQAGLVTALDNGTATAKATANDGSGVYGTLIITISNQVIPVASIIVTGAGGATLITIIGGTLQLSAAILPSNSTNKTVTWSISSGTDKASISSTGLVTALSNGTAVARATANDGSGVYGTLTLTISNQVIPVTSISVTGAGGATTISTDNGTLQLSANVLPAAATNKTVTWSITSGTDKASISSTGLVTALDNGAAVAMATANDGSGVYGTLTLTISNQIIPVTSISVTGAGGATTISTDNGTLQLIAALLPANATNKSVTWSITSGSDKASISSSGLITAQDNGTAVARATANDGSGVYGTLTLTISNQVIPVTNISVTGAGGSTAISTDNGTLQLIAALLPANATNKTVTWSITSGSDKASISSTGLVTALDNGTAVVRATANDGSGVYGILTFTISNQANQVILVTSIAVTGAGGTTTISSDNGPFQLSANVLPTNATNKTVTWSITSGSDKASISPTGLVTISDTGTVTAKATANDLSEIYGTFVITISDNKNSPSYENLSVKVYPNPASDHINIRIDASTFSADFLQIISLSGTILLQEKLDHDLKEFTIPFNLKQGLYIVQIRSGKMTFFAQKLLVCW